MTVDLTRTLPPDSPAALALERGRSLRTAVPRRSHGGWTPAADRPDPVATLMASNEGRLPHLVPIRIGRMLASPFAFLRGSAAVMAADLATTPVTGSMVQLCGDAHLANFGVFASPERRLVFDLNDFDETHRGPWEWDVKRLAASFVVASRENGYPEATCRDMARTVAWELPRWIRTYAGMRALQVWYAAIPIESIIERVERARDRAYLDIAIDEARRRDHLGPSGSSRSRRPVAAGSSAIGRRSCSDSPTTTRVGPPCRPCTPPTFGPWRRTVASSWRSTDCWTSPSRSSASAASARAATSPCSPARPAARWSCRSRRPASPCWPRTSAARRHGHQGERVVTGQRIMQAVSDSFLGWTKSPVTGTEYYVRQLHDMKYGIDIGGLRPAGMRLYAEVCAWALARAHARSGNPAEIAGYLGAGDVFDEAIAAFAVAYADQTERDHAALAAAVRAGRLAVETGV